MNEFAPLDALAVGINVVDILVQLPDHFTPGEKQPARDLVLQGGGPAATAACVLGAFGWRTGFVTRMGDNALSAITRAEFKTIWSPGRFLHHGSGGLTGPRGRPRGSENRRTHHLLRG